jgi:Cof subfamily protein (haloacid dehalogenase superfamily)
MDTMLRVIALDMDGTLLASDESVSRRTIDSLEAWRNQGSRLVIATGRPACCVIGYLPDLFRDAPYVCYNGAEVFDDGIRIAQAHLEPETALEIIRTIEEHSSDVAISVAMRNKLFANRPLKSRWPHEVVDLYEVIRDPVPKIMFRVADVQDRDSLLRSLPTECRCIIHSGSLYGEVVAASASKTNGLAILLDRWGLTFRNMISFGDDIADLEMIAESGIGVAMGNAIPEIKAAADRVTGSNNDDGIAQILEVASTWR